MSNLPSTLQQAYAEGISSFLSTDMVRAYWDAHKEIKHATTGAGPTSQLPKIPESMVREWAAISAENLRKLILNYYRESGFFAK